MRARPRLLAALGLVLALTASTVPTTAAAGADEPDLAVAPAQDVHVHGSLRGIRVTWSPPASNPEAVTGYTVVVEPCGVVRTLPPSTRMVSVRITPRSCGSRYEVHVVPRDAMGNGPLCPTEQDCQPILAWLGMPVAVQATRDGAYVNVKGALRTFERTLRGRSVALQRRSPNGWRTILTVETKRYGRFRTTIRHRKRATYRVVFFGGPDLVGDRSARHRW